MVAQYSDHRAAEVRQYSRTVRWMKVVLPIGAVLLIGLIFLAGNSRDPIVGSESMMDAATLGAGLRLENPRFAGVTDSGEPFVVTAISALPDGAMPDRVDLDRPSSELHLSDGRRINVTSHAGQFYRIGERLVLDGDVRVVTSDGYRVETDHVDIDLEAREADVPGTFSVAGPSGELDSDRASMRTEGTGRAMIFRFEGNVRVKFDPSVADR